MSATIDLWINGRLWAEDPQGAPLRADAFAEWSPIEIACQPVADAVSATLAIGGEDLGAPTLTPFDPTWRWRWLPRGVAGEVHGLIKVVRRDGASLERVFGLRLLPRLIDEQDWAALLADSARMARGLAVALGGAAFANATLVPLRPDDVSPLEEALALLERHSQGLEATARQLAARPESTLRASERRQRLGEIAAPDPNALVVPPDDLDWDAGDDEQPAVRELRSSLGGALPRSLPVKRSVDSPDIPEHRWLVGLIELVERRLRAIRRLAEEEQARPIGERAAAALRDLQGRIERSLGNLRRRRQEPPLAGLPARRSPPAQSQRMARDRRYRPLRRIWRELRESPLLALEAPQLGLPIADLPSLYEQWCALAVAEALLGLGLPVIRQGLLAERSDRERWTVQLATEAPLLELMAGGRTWRLRYQPRYGSRPDALGLVALDAYTRIPDLVLEILEPGAPPRLVVFDAKYRRAPDKRVPQDALDDAYAYRGSLGKDGAPLVAYAAILYPHNGPGEDFGPVGAIPLLPGHRAPLRDLLERLIAASADD